MVDAQPVVIVAAIGEICVSFFCGVAVECSSAFCSASGKGNNSSDAVYFFDLSHL